MLTLEVGPGFLPGAVDGEEEQLVFATWRPETKQVELVVASRGLGTQRVIGRLPSQTISAAPIVVHRATKRVYVPSDRGIWEFPLEGGEASLLVGFPDTPAATRLELQQAHGPSEHFANWEPQKKGRPSYHWAFELDVAANRLFALCGQTGVLDHLVEVDLEARAFVSHVPLAGSGAGIELDVKRRSLVLPAMKDGARVFSFSGQELARWSGEERFGRAAIRTGDGAVVMEQEKGSLLLWDWRRGTHEHFADDACAPCVSPEGVLFFMRTAAELWMKEPGAPPRLVVKALGNEGGTERDRKRSWATSPTLSPDARYLLAQPTAILKTSTGDQVVREGAVIDLAAGRVTHVARFVGHNPSWF